MEKFDKKRLGSLLNKSLIIFIAFLIMISLFKLFLYHNSQKNLISQFKNTHIRENLVINNKKVKLNKPYKIKGETVYVPIIELCENFGADTSYTFKPYGGIDLKYKKSIYHLKRGSNIVEYSNRANKVTIDGPVVYMEDTLYMPIDFIYKVLDVNVEKASNGTVYMNNYPYKFNYDWIKQNKFIAHALGGVDGFKYTNTKEAMESSYNKGIRVLEGDLTMTSDGKLVLCHSFSKEYLKAYKLPENWSSEKPTQKKFLSEKIKGKYTTLSFEDIANYMKEHKDVYFVVDLKDNSTSNVNKSYKELLRVGKNVDTEILKRIIPQINNSHMYKPIMNIYNFKSMIYTIYDKNEKEISKAIDFSFEHGIKILSINNANISKDLQDKINNTGMGIYMFNYNNEQEISNFKYPFIRGVYTDFLPTQKINRDKEGNIMKEVDNKKNTTPSNDTANNNANIQEIEGIN
ncbi:stalk domain-containing protein [Peptostreptococcus equinus]|uniref:Stalk domain-containing protein n=1 Tax=Peptostreptococcus equinus TaxID=3003601 RepID=A0ABY7JTP1_9FIRM|nr:stalk domain-containing protein [Peptostreptococcus sp. CBA3647]WAW15518.1 stalk domain-containing protein [Peptostreptococcus sp. CBA3647]